MTGLDKVFVAVGIVLVYWLAARMMGQGYSNLLLRPGYHMAALLGSLVFLLTVTVLAIVVTVLAFEVQGIGWMWVPKTILALFSLAGAGLACLDGLYLGPYKV